MKCKYERKTKQQFITRNIHLIKTGNRNKHLIMKNTDKNIENFKLDYRRNTYLLKCPDPLKYKNYTLFHLLMSRKG